MSGLTATKITKREFFKVLGLSSTSLLMSEAIADEILAKTRREYSASTAIIPVVAKIKPNAFLHRPSTRFSSIVVFPEGYKAEHVNVSSVRCEGAHAVDSILHPGGRTIAFIHNSGDLGNDLCGVVPLDFKVTGCLLDGSTFAGSDTVMMLNADRCCIYHTSSRKRKSCNACKRHAANRMYPSRQWADLDRTHPGCNCRIVEEEIGWQDYTRAFWNSSQGGTTVYDRRWGWPPPSPPDLSLEFPFIQ